MPALGTSTVKQLPPKCKVSKKHRYPDRDQAVATAEYQMAISFDRTMRLYVYPCPFCKDWHLTSKPQADGRQPEKLV